MSEAEQKDYVLLGIIENYTQALNKISLEIADPDNFDIQYRAIQQETAQTILQYYTSKQLIEAELLQARIGELTLLAKDTASLQEGETWQDWSYRVVDYLVKRTTELKSKQEHQQ